MEQAQQEKVYMERLPLVAMQIRSALGNIYYGMQKLAPADERDEDPILDANAAMLYHGYFRLLRLAKNLESASMLNRKGAAAHRKHGPEGVAGRDHPGGGGPL